MLKLCPTQPQFLDIIELGKEIRTPLKEEDQLSISTDPKILVTNSKTLNKKTKLIFDLEENHVPFLFIKDGPTLKELDKTSKPNQFEGTFQRGDIIQILEIEQNLKRELPVATVKVVGLRTDGSITVEHSVHKWNGFFVKQ